MGMGMCIVVGILVNMVTREMGVERRERDWEEDWEEEDLEDWAEDQGVREVTEV